MDFKGKFIVFLCVIGMAINWHFMQKNMEQQRAVAAEKAKVEAAKKEAEAAAEKAQTDKAKPADAPASATAPEVPEETREIKAGSVTYVFSNKGGGVRKAILAGTDQITINTHGKDAIGAFRSEPGVLDATPYKITEATDKKIVFEGFTADGLGIRKTFTLTEGETGDEHLLKLNLVITNNGKTALAGSQRWLYAGTAETHNPSDTSIQPSAFANDGGGLTAVEHPSLTEEDGWFSKAKPTYDEKVNELRFGGVMSRFYTTILSTKEGLIAPGRLWVTRFQLDHSKDEWKDAKGADADWAVQASVGLPPLDVAPGATQAFDLELYTGPKEYHRLAKLDRQRSLVMGYRGILYPVKWMLINLLRWFHDLVNSWGMAIILLTIVVKTFLWWPQMKAQRSMKRMSKLSPLMKEMQEKYKDDPTRQSQEMMKLYRDYGVNPLGGCLPIAIQMPIFFGLLGILQVCAELRGQSFFWVKDLSLPDTIGHLPLLGWAINPLPILMGLTQVLMMKVMPQPATVDKMQQRIMTFMPFIFVFICYFFASALALYYTIQNIYSLVQTIIMQRLHQDDDGPLQKVKRDNAAPAAGPSLFGGGMPPQKPKKDKKGPPRLGGG